MLSGHTSIPPRAFLPFGTAISLNTESAFTYLHEEVSL
jgi:hypothetical protein